MSSKDTLTKGAKPEKAGKKRMPLALKIILIILAVIIGLVLIAFGAINIAKFVSFGDYLSLRTDVCAIPGINSGFVNQGVGYDDETGEFVISGYTTAEGSRIYITDGKDPHLTYLQDANGNTFDGHCGGVDTDGESIYIATDDCIWIVDYDEAENNDTVRLDNFVEVNNQASFVFVEDEYIYVGEFNDDVNYVTNHPYTTDEGQHNAIISQYSLSDFASHTADSAESSYSPIAIYSIRNRVQGFCILDDGRMVLSTSWGTSASEFYVYDSSCLKDSGETMDGAPVYYLQNEIDVLSGLPMAEDMTVVNGKACCMYESATNKYIFGKLYFDTNIYTLDL